MSRSSSGRTLPSSSGGTGPGRSRRVRSSRRAASRFVDEALGCDPSPLREHLRRRSHRYYGASRRGQPEGKVPPTAAEIERGGCTVDGAAPHQRGERRDRRGGTSRSTARCWQRSCRLVPAMRPSSRSGSCAHRRQPALARAARSRSDPRWQMESASSPQNRNSCAGESGRPGSR